MSTTQSHLVGLNPAQLRAVEHSPQTPLQILAGPGSGKTRVLTCRIAHLIIHHAIKPSSLCAVTFTNKAAMEMRVRLKKLIGQGKTDQIQMGTFHALCAKFLRRHADKVGISGNFTICDAEESKKLIKKLLEPYREYLENLKLEVPEPGAVAAKISKAKAKGLSPQDLLSVIPVGQLRPSDVIAKVVAEIYREYQRNLRKSNSLDFDDLLVRGVDLFRDHPTVAKWCKHILVDEFQDTNTMQYELMKYIAAANKCVTIVGDPDQSIYGWRSAEIENLRKMSRDYPSVVHILLEQNYRSTGAILAASIAIVAQDKNRMPKSLYTSHPFGSRPLLYAFESGDEEGIFIASEIKRLIAYTGGMLNYNDFAVLLRYNALSRLIERELQKEGIPNRVLGGRKFFERLEVKDVLAYLQIVDNPHYAPAFIRVINAPTRAIGPKTVEQILSRATELKISPVDVVERIYDGKIPDTKPAVKRKLATFVEAIRSLRPRAEEGSSPSILIPKLLEIVKYSEHLQKTQSDWEERWMNVMELMNFAAEMQWHETKREQVLAHGPRTTPPPNGQWHWVDNGEVTTVDRAVQSEPSTTGDDLMEDTPLRLFLQASMLSTDAETSEDDNAPKVTISTCHAAKGLEWPAVFIPAVEKGTFPAARAEDIEEERRLLYVACTRAQSYLTLTHTASRYTHGKMQVKELSPFISCLAQRIEVLFTEQMPKVDDNERKLVAVMLERTLPSETEIAQKIREHNEQARDKPRSGLSDPRHPEHRTRNVQPELHVHQGPATFTTAGATLREQKQTTVTKQNLVRAPLSSSKDQVVNGASRAQPKKPKTTGSRTLGKNSHPPTIIDLRSPSPRPVQPPRNLNRIKPGHRTQEAKLSSPSNPITSGSSSASALKTVIDLRSPSPEIKQLMQPRVVIGVKGKPMLASGSSSSTSSGKHPPPKTVARLLRNLDMAPRQQSAKASDATSSSSTLQATEMPMAVDPPTIASPIVLNPNGLNIEPAEATKPTGNGKKRLGMGRHVVGYPNKRFKAPS